MPGLRFGAGPGGLTKSCLDRLGKDDLFCGEIVLLGQRLVFCGCEKLVPVFAAELNFRCFSGITDSVGVGCADDGNDFGRMFE